MGKSGKTLRVSARMICRRWRRWRWMPIRGSSKNSRHPGSLVETKTFRTRNRGNSRGNGLRRVRRRLLNPFKGSFVKARSHPTPWPSLISHMRIIRPKTFPRRQRSHRKHSLPCPYRKRASLLTRGELAFFQVLRRAAPQYLVSIKTRLADVVECPQDLWESVHGRRLSQKHVDFVLYDGVTAAIRAVIELDDRSHDRRDRVKRDEFLRAVLQFTGVPLIRVRAAARYSMLDLRSQIVACIGRPLSPPGVIMGTSPRRQGPPPEGPLPPGSSTLTPQSRAPEPLREVKGVESVHAVGRHFR
jgi:hypothetical protein